MTLEDAYNQIRTTLRSQVQGTCGLYSFYNAVCILREINSNLPSVPSPKKSEASSSATTSLREYAKRELKSGQGEILTEAEMTAFVKAWGYKTESCGKDSTAAKSDFMTMQTKGGHPVLVAYLADQDTTGIVPVPNAATSDPGAHWSLVIGAKGTNVLVVEPNEPGSLKTWSSTGLLQANADADCKKFDRFWAKEVTEIFRPHSSTPFSVDKGGVLPIKDPTNWAPNTTQGVTSRGKVVKKTQTKLYDLGGATGTRHTRQKLSHVLIAIIPPS